MTLNWLNSSRFRAKAAGILLALLVVCGGSLSVSASKTDLVKLSETTSTQVAQPIVTLTRGMAEVIDMPGPIADIMVADPSLVDVQVLQSNRLYLVGVDYGSTNIIALDAGGNIISRMTVHVKMDESVIQAMVDKLFPDEEVQIASRLDQVILTGHVSTPDVAQSIANLVAQYAGEAQGGGGGTVDGTIVNMLTVAGEQQVMLKVKIVEASRDVLRELGVDTDFTRIDAGDFSGSIATAVAGLTSTPLGVGSVVYDSGSSGLGPINFAIRALETEGLINTLAEPNLTAISGEQAGFLAGGEFPIPSSRDQNGNVVVDYRPFGVALNFRPIVMSGDRISLLLQTEVSNVSNQGLVDIGGISVPSFTVRRASTTVELGSGSSLMIAGLLQSDASQSLSKLPGIGDIPVLGKLVSSDSFQRNESELLVIVTAYLVKPYAEGSNTVEELSVEQANPLAIAFANNIRRTYAKLALSDELFAEDGRYGYLLE